MIVVYCKARLDRPDLPRGQRVCGEQVTMIHTDLFNAKYIQITDFGCMYFRCGHADDKDNNALAPDIEQSYRNGN